jgi:hypothetical protein
MHKVWLYAPGENASKWDVCLSQNIMCIGWDEMGNLLEYASKKEMAARLQEIYDKPEASFKNDSLALWEFAHEMQAGDIVIVKKGQNQIIGRGIVEGDYAFDESFPDFKNVRKMQWTNAGEWENIGKNVQKTLTDITKYPDYVESLEKLFEDKSQKQYWWQDRLVAPLADKGVVIGHKTGTGDLNAKGQQIGCNDIGFVLLPDGRTYSIAVFVKDSEESFAENSKIIADISRIVYEYAMQSAK